MPDSPHLLRTLPSLKYEGALRVYIMQLVLSTITLLKIKIEKLKSFIYLNENDNPNIDYYK